MDYDLLSTNNINQDFTLNNNIHQDFTLNNNIHQENTEFIQEHQEKLRKEYAKNKIYIQNPNTKDLFEDNYKKLKYNYINIDSRNQNQLNNIKINLDKPLTNIYSISLKDINLPYTSPPIHENNNIIQWKYAKESDFNCENKLNPNPIIKTQIYSSNDITYETTISPGFYNTNELEQELMNKMNKVIHQSLFTSSSHNSITPITGDIVANGETYTDLQNQQHNFHIKINPIKHQVTFINRAEELIPITIETLLFNNYSDNFYRPQDTLGWMFKYHINNENPIPNPISNVNDLLQSSPNSIYFTLPVIIINDNNSSPSESTSINWEIYNKKVEDLRSGSGLPLIPTNFPDIGGFSKDLINNHEYYPVNYLPTGWNGRTYEFVDTLTYFSGGYNNNYSLSSITKIFLYRFKLNLIENGNTINCRNRELFILNPDINEINYRSDINNLYCGGIESFHISLSQTIGSYHLFKDKKQPMIGRGLPFKFEINEKSILNILAWPISNCDTIVVSDSCNYKTIQNNYDSYITDKSDYFTGKGNILKKYLNIEYISKDNYIFKGEDYIFMKLILEKNYDNFIKAYSKINNELYDYDSNSNNDGIENNTFKNILTKIYFNNKIIENIKLFENENSIQKLEFFIIQFIGANGELLNIKSNYDLTLCITENKIVLKNSLLNSKTNKINSTGNIIQNINLNSVL
jgi:hypothetical protein